MARKRVSKEKAMKIVKEHIEEGWEVGTWCKKGIIRLSRGRTVKTYRTYPKAETGLTSDIRDWFFGDTDHKIPGDYGTLVSVYLEEFMGWGGFKKDGD